MAGLKWEGKKGISSIRCLIIVSWHRHREWVAPFLTSRVKSEESVMFVMFVCCSFGLCGCLIEWTEKDVFGFNRKKKGRKAWAKGSKHNHLKPCKALDCLIATGSHFKQVRRRTRPRTMNQTKTYLYMQMTWHDPCVLDDTHKSSCVCKPFVKIKPDVGCGIGKKVPSVRGQGLFLEG